MASTRAHFPSGQSGGVDVCPTLLDCFSMSPSNTLCVIERIVGLTRCTVTGEMEFRNEVRELEVLDIEIRVVVGSSLEEVDGPFAGDIIRDDNIADGEAL